MLMAAALAGCAADSRLVENMMVVPSYYDTLECRELVGQYAAASSRVKELAALMEKAGGGPGGAFVNALAYDTDYARARATERAAGEAAARKNCTLPKDAAAKPVEPVEPPKPARIDQPRLMH